MVEWVLIPALQFYDGNTEGLRRASGPKQFCGRATVVSHQANAPSIAMRQKGAGRRPPATAGIEPLLMVVLA